MESNSRHFLPALPTDVETARQGLLYVDDDGPYLHYPIRQFTIRDPAFAEQPSFYIHNRALTPAKLITEYASVMQEFGRRMLEAA